MDDGSDDRRKALDQAIRDCAKGRADGIDRIVELEGPQLFGVAQRMLGRQDLAEEALQDALVQI